MNVGAGDVELDEPGRAGVVGGEHDQDKVAEIFHGKRQQVSGARCRVARTDGAGHGAWQHMGYTVGFLHFGQTHACDNDGAPAQDHFQRGGGAVAGADVQDHEGRLGTDIDDVGREVERELVQRTLRAAEETPADAGGR